MTDRSQAVVEYRARFDECGPDATLRASALLRWAQDVAWIHSERLGFGREWYADRDLAWVVRGLHLVVLEPIRMGTGAEVTTRVAGFRRVMARRRTDVRLPDGSLAAWAYTDWVMTDTARGVPTRVPPDFPGYFDAPPVGFEPIRVDPPVAPPGAVTRHLVVRPQELDPMAHANNAVYVDWLEEAVREGGGEAVVASLPRTYRLEYLASAAPGQQLVARAWPADPADPAKPDVWHHVLRAATGPADPRGADASGQILLRGSLATGGSDPDGGT